MTSYNKPKMAVTHAGVFHADEVFAYAFLRIINPDIKLRRVYQITHELIKELNKDYGDEYIIFDIGGGEYDHHTDASAENRDNVLNPAPYASFGKVVRRFWPYIFKSERAFHIFDSKLCVPIDMADCTGRLFKGDANELSLAISSFNPNWNEDQSSEASDISFKRAADLAGAIIQRYVKRADAIIESEDIMNEALRNRERGERYIVLPQYVNYQTYLHSLNVDWVIYPSKRGGWQLYSILERGHNKSLIGEEIMKQMKNDPHCTFVHVGGFTAVFDTKESAISYAKQLRIQDDKKAEGSPY